MTYKFDPFEIFNRAMPGSSLVSIVDKITALSLKSYTFLKKVENLLCLIRGETYNKFSMITWVQKQIIACSFFSVLCGKSFTVENKQVKLRLTMTSRTAERKRTSGRP